MIESLKIDSTDLKILQLLNQNGRYTYTELGKKLFLTSSAIQLRVKRLMDIGLIKRAGLVIDYDLLGYKLICYVGIMVRQGKYTKSVEKQLKKMPEVTVASYTTGRFTLFCKVRTRDTASMKGLLQDIQEIKGVERTESMVSFEEVFNSRDRLLDQILKEHEANLKTK